MTLPIWSRCFANTILKESLLVLCSIFGPIPAFVFSRSPAWASLRDCRSWLCQVEADAQLRRADIVAVLESRFGEVQTFDSQLEMAQAAHTLWQTMRRQDSWQPPQRNQAASDGQVDQDQSLDAATKSSVLPSDRDEVLTRQPAVRSRLMPCRRMHSHRHAIRHSRRLTCPSTRIYRLIAIHCFRGCGLESSTETSASTGTIAATDANAETISETETNTETIAETVANTETIADANTLDARSAKPKRRSRTPRRGSAAGAGDAAGADANTETIAATEVNTETATETANTQPVFEHSDQTTVEKQSQNEPVSSGARLSVTITLCVSVDFDPIWY